MTYISLVVALLKACDVTTMVAILYVTKNQKSGVNRENGTFLCFKHFALFQPQYFLLLLKKLKKTCIFTQKWLDHLLLMTSYLVTIASDHHLTCLKICARDERTDVLSSMKKLRKTLWGLGSSHPPLYVRGLNLNQNEQACEKGQSVVRPSESMVCACLRFRTGKMLVYAFRFRQTLLTNTRLRFWLLQISPI